MKITQPNRFIVGIAPKNDIAFNYTKARESVTKLRMVALVDGHELYTREWPVDWIAPRSPTKLTGDWYPNVDILKNYNPFVIDIEEPELSGLSKASEVYLDAAGQTHEVQTEEPVLFVLKNTSGSPAHMRLEVLTVEGWKDLMVYEIPDNTMWLVTILGPLGARVALESGEVNSAAYKIPFAANATIQLRFQEEDANGNIVDDTSVYLPTMVLEYALAQSRINILANVVVYFP